MVRQAGRESEIPGSQKGYFDRGYMLTPKQKLARRESMECMIWCRALRHGLARELDGAFDLERLEVVMQLIDKHLPQATETVKYYDREFMASLKSKKKVKR